MFQKITISKMNEMRITFKNAKLQKIKMQRSFFKFSQISNNKKENVNNN